MRIKGFRVLTVRYMGKLVVDSAVVQESSAPDCSGALLRSSDRVRVTIPSAERGSCFGGRRFARISGKERSWGAQVNRSRWGIARLFAVT
jgi:hypothetical protein